LVRADDVGVFDGSRQYNIEYLVEPFIEVACSDLPAEFSPQCFRITVVRAEQACPGHLVGSLMSVPCGQLSFADREKERADLRVVPAFARKLRRDIIDESPHRRQQVSNRGAVLAHRTLIGRLL
jgi:hypothetical protein